MSALKDRETAFETKYANDQDKLFRIEARACKLLGLWAANRMEYSQDVANSYALDLVSHNLTEPGLGDVISKVTADLIAAGHDTSDVSDTMIKYLAEAEMQLNA